MGEDGNPREEERERSDEPTRKEASFSERLRSGEPAGSYFRVTRLSLVYRYFFVSVLTVVGVVFLLLILPPTLSAKDIPLLVILAFWMLALLRYWIYLLDMPHRVLCREGDSLYFFSMLRRREVRLKDIVEIKASPIYPSYVKFLVSKKKRKKIIPMVNHVTGLHELIRHIKEVNPELVTKGC